MSPLPVLPRYRWKIRDKKNRFPRFTLAHYHMRNSDEDKKKKKKRKWTQNIVTLRLQDTLEPQARTQDRHIMKDTRNMFVRTFNVCTFLCGCNIRWSYTCAQNADEENVPHSQHRDETCRGYTTFLRVYSRSSSYGQIIAKTSVRVSFPFSSLTRSTLYIIRANFVITYKSLTLYSAMYNF